MSIWSPVEKTVFQLLCHSEIWTVRASECWRN